MVRAAALLFAPVVALAVPQEGFARLFKRVISAKMTIPEPNLLEDGLAMTELLGLGQSPPQTPATATDSAAGSVGGNKCDFECAGAGIAAYFGSASLCAVAFEQNPGAALGCITLGCPVLVGMVTEGCLKMTPDCKEGGRRAGAKASSERAASGRSDTTPQALARVRAPQIPATTAARNTATGDSARESVSPFDIDLHYSVGRLQHVAEAVQREGFDLGRVGELLRNFDLGRVGAAAAETGAGLHTLKEFVKNFRPAEGAHQLYV